MMPQKQELSGQHWGTVEGFDFQEETDAVRKTKQNKTT